MSREIMLVAGETSGDQYAAELVDEARQLDPELSFFGLGGDRIYAGQKLKLAGDGNRTHVVQHGETLAAIARRYGTTVRQIQSANRIRNHIIRPRQVLIIP